MKNLKKILALVVALTMVLGTVSFAAFTDVAEDANEYTAVSTLASLNILNGYEDGSFKPDGDITRAEFCAVVCRALGASVSGNAVTGFSDVPADHWASGYIAYAAGQRIVNGRGNGIFDPEAQVTYQEAVKMLVMALGFEPMAESKGGYPTGYMVVANTYEMTKDVASNGQTAPASRGVVAQLTYNALDIPMMEQTGFGKDREEFTVQDGTEGKLYKTLLTNLDVAKLEGVVEGTHIIGDECEIGEVAYKINYANQDEYWTDYEEEDAVIIKVAEGVKADDYFGIASIVYVKEISNKKYEIIAIMQGDDSELVELALDDLDEETTDSTIFYYASASSSKTSKYKLDEDCQFYYNYNKVDSFEGIVKDDSDKIYENRDMAITLIENNGDSSFDMVVVEEYDYDRVKAIDVEADEIEGSSSNTFEFDFDDEEISISIVDKDGEEIGLEDIKEGDVLAYMSSEYNESDLSDVDGTYDYEWIKIINLGESFVTGVVDEVKSNDSKVFIDGNEYGYTLSGIKLGDEGTFYLTKSGKIFDVEKDASVSGNYAYILETGLNETGFSAAWQVKLLTKDNEIVIYTVRDNFKIDDVVYDEAAEDAGILSDLEGEDFKANVEDRIITYKLDSKGYIRQINSAYSVSEKFEDKEYNSDVQTLGADIEDDVVIFNISGSSMSAAYAAGLSYLVDEGKYDGYMVSNEEEEFDCIVITAGTSLIDVTQDLAIVENVTKATIDEGATDALKIRYYTSNEAEVKELIVVDDEDVTTLEWGTDLDMFDVGTIFMFADNGEGTATSVAVIATANSATDEESDAYTVNETATAAIADIDEDITFGEGFIDTYESTTKGMRIKTTDGGSFVIKSGANEYTYYNRTASKIVIEVGNWKKGDVAKAKDGLANAYFTKIFNGSVTDIVTFSTRKAY